ncbi:MAG: hypothetical protein II443_07480 [Oscillospiraceae bacterium]|nr:hypothetical protein [Oscillospiraceae bacterium]
MAGNIKGITIEFRGDTSKLDKSLRQINNETRSIDKELNQVNKSLKFNPTNVELWRQKQQLLTQKVSETKEKLDLLKQAQAQMDNDDSVDKTSKEYRELQRDIIETESKVKNFENQLRQVGNVNLRAASEQVKELGGKLESAGQALMPLSAAGAAVAGGIGALAYKSGQAADDLNTLSKVTGISTYELQKYNAAADLVDVSTEAIAKSHAKLSKNMAAAANGSKTQAAAFEQLGVRVTNADGSLRDSDAVFQDVITALGGMKNETERDALAMQLMGKSAMELNPLIEDQGETYKNVADTLAKYNLDFVDQETLDKANEFNDELDMMKVLGTTSLSIVGAQLAEYLAPALEKVVELMGKLAEWLSGLDPRLLTVIGAIAALVAGIAPLLIILGKVAFAISSIMSLMSTLGLSFGALMGPVGIVIGIIAALIAIGVLLYKNWDTIKAKLTALKDWFAKTFDAIKNKTVAVFNAIKNAIMTPIRTAVDFVRNMINKIKGFFNFKVSLPHIKLPHFSIKPKGWKLSDLLKGSIPHLGISWYAQGGIFNSPSVIGVGEAGPEAVLPIEKLQVMLGSMADDIVNGVNMGMRLAGAGEQVITIPIYLYPSGPKMGEETVKIYDQYKRILG